MSGPSEDAARPLEHFDLPRGLSGHRGLPKRLTRPLAGAEDEPVFSSENEDES